MKRAFDLLLSALALIILSPLFLVIVPAILLTSSGPAIFRQQRMGRNFRPFTLLKFRTMREAETDHEIDFSGDRITSVGHFLRRAKLDELPSKAAEAMPAGDGPDRSGVGLSVQPLTPETARRLGIDATAGLLVTNIDPSGPAADAGLQKGDVIEEVEGKQVQSVAELRKELSRAGDRPALMLVRRGESSLYLTLDPHA